MSKTIRPILPTLPHLQIKTPFRFLSIGECMVEMAPTAAVGEYQIGFAGDTFNTAWYMRQLRPDVFTRYFSRVGQDAVSDSMLDMMQEAGIDVTHIGRSANYSVGLYLISLKDRERSFSYWRDSSAARQLSQNPAEIKAALKGIGLAYFSGITMAILDDAGRATLLKILSEARAGGTIIAFDSNLRPRLWTNETDMRAAIMAAAEISDIVLPSFEDEATYFGDKSIEATAERYRNAGAKSVIVKNGGGAIYFTHDGGAGLVTPPKGKRIVDTTAAGDSFNAGIFAGLDCAKSMEDLIEFASQISGQVIEQKGALVPLNFGIAESKEGTRLTAEGR